MDPTSDRNILATNFPIFKKYERFGIAIELQVIYEAVQLSSSISLKVTGQKR